jgi:hypothetical protein
MSGARGDVSRGEASLDDRTFPANKKSIVNISDMVGYSKEQVIHLPSPPDTGAEAGLGTLGLL